MTYCFGAFDCTRCLHKIYATVIFPCLEFYKLAQKIWGPICGKCCVAWLKFFSLEVKGAQLWCWKT